MWGHTPSQARLLHYPGANGLYFGALRFMSVYGVLKRLSIPRGVAMRFTQKQQRYLRGYLRSVKECLTDLPERMRNDAVEKLGRRIDRSFADGDGSVPSDERVAQAVKSMGNASERASLIREELEALPEPEEGCWLGVCERISLRTGIAVGGVRTLAVLLGCVTGPVALWGYICCYAFMYIADDYEDLPRVDFRKLAWRVAGTVSSAAALLVGARLVVFLMVFAYLKYLPVETFDNDEISLMWLLNWSMLLIALFTVTPLAVLGGLPVSERWSGTLKKVWQAVLAVYAVLLSLGIASVMVNIALRVLDEIMS